MTRRQIGIFVSMTALLCGASLAGAADDLDSLRARFKERYSQLQKLKEAGKIGETWEGYVEAVKGEFKEEVAAVVGDENGDRRKLYKLMANEEGITAEEIAKNNAVRNFNKAKKGEYLKGPDGAWKQKS
jgi:uncharacterized protein